MTQVKKKKGQAVLSHLPPHRCVTQTQRETLPNIGVMSAVFGTCVVHCRNESKGSNPFLVRELH